jgi:hypothetical protein
MRFHRGERLIAVVLTLVLAGVAASSAHAKTIYLSQIEAHVDTVARTGLVEGTVTAAPDAPRRCLSRRSVRILREDGKVLSTGETLSDGSFSVRLRGNAQRARVLEQGIGARERTICAAAETFISFFVE